MPTTASAARPDRTVSYGDHPDQVYDVRAARNEPKNATVVVVHGGFWRPGWDRSHATEQSEALAEAGYDVATVEYRRIPGDWPATAHDVLAALEAVAAHPDLAPRRVLLGHSAGGQLVTWAACQPETRVAGAVSLAGCVDLHLARSLGLGDGAAAALLGSADEQVWRAADPALLGAPPVPVHLVHGAADTTVPVEVSESYQAATGAGVPLHVLAGSGHQELIDPQSPFFQASLRSIQDVLDEADPASTGPLP